MSGCWALTTALFSWIGRAWKPLSHTSDLGLFLCLLQAHFPSSHFSIPPVVQLKEAQSLCSLEVLLGKKSRGEPDPHPVDQPGWVDEKMFLVCGSQREPQRWEQSFQEFMFHIHLFGFTWADGHCHDPRVLGSWYHSSPVEGNKALSLRKLLP